MSSGVHAAPAQRCETTVARRSEFPGAAEYVVGVRQWLRASLAGCPAAGDAALLASELVTNALMHSASDQGGTFAVTVSHRTADVRIEVADQGGPWTPGITGDELHGRGLVIVSSLARAWGIVGNESGRTVWFELDCR